MGYCKALGEYVRFLYEFLSNFPKTWHIDLYRVLLDESRNSDQLNSKHKVKSLVDGIMNYIREAQVVDDHVQKASANPLASDNTHPTEEDIHQR